MTPDAILQAATSLALLLLSAGLLVTDSWYWDQDAESRKFAQRFFAKFKRMPSSIQAAGELPRKSHRPFSA